MEGGGMSGGGLQPNVSAAMLGLDMHQQQQIHQPQRHLQQPPPQQLHPLPSQPQSLTQHTLYALLPSSTRQPKQQQQRYQHQQMSLEERQEHDSRHPAAAAAAASPWQRMKWTDAMVKLLIMIVYHVGDEAGADHPSSSSEDLGASKAGVGKKTSKQSLPQQKKGKWKSVSRAMMERGYSVSPQQCEDKFNDLNKRYKRINDILGRGTARRVVENQASLDAMDHHLSPKAKEEARKLLNSKHLFYGEMSAYHASCAAAVAAPGGAPPNALSPAAHHHPGPAESTEPSGQQHCFHTTKMVAHRPGMAIEEEEDDHDDDEEDGGDAKHHGQRHGDDGEEEEGSKVFMAETETTSSSGTKRQRRSTPQQSASTPGTPPASQQLSCELMGLTGPVERQRQWVRSRVAELEETKVEYHRRALDLERQMFRWQRFSGNKEREMEKRKIQNERLRLDSEQMLLLLRQKELDLTFAGDGGGPGNHSPAMAAGMVGPDQQQHGCVLFQQPTRFEPGSIRREN